MRLQVGMSRWRTMSKYKLQINLFIFISLIDSIVGTGFAIGILFFVQEKELKVFSNGLVSNIGSFATILVILFIGAFIDRKSKKYLLVITNFLMATLAWVPGYFFQTSFFLTIIIIIDLFVTLFSLMGSISSESYIKILVRDYDINKVVGIISIVTMVGTIIGLFLMEYGLDYLKPKIFFIVISLVYFIMGILAIFLKKDNAIVNSEEKGNYKDIVKIVKLYKSSKFHVNNFVMTTAFGAYQSVSIGLVIFYWSKIDKQFNHSNILLMGLGIGIVLGIVLMNIIKDYSMVIFWISGLISIISTLSIPFCKSPWPLSISLGVTLGSIVVITSMLKSIRIKKTQVNMQARVTSMIKLGISILSLIVVIFIGFIGDLLQFIYLPVYFTAIISLIVMLFCSSSQKVAEYEKAYSYVENEI